MWMLSAPGTFITFARGLSSICLTRLGGTPRAMSTCPVTSEATRVVSSGIGLKTTVFTFGAPRQ
jgi:hypothetical protein